MDFFTEHENFSSPDSMLQQPKVCLFFGIFYVYVAFLYEKQGLFVMQCTFQMDNSKLSNTVQPEEGPNVNFSLSSSVQTEQRKSTIGTRKTPAKKSSVSN